MLLLPDDDLPQLGGELLLGLLALGLEHVQLRPAVHPQLQLLVLALDDARHPDAVRGERELEVEGGPAVVLLAAVVAAAAAADLLAEDDVVVVEEDVAPLTLVAAEEHLARRHEGALAAAAAAATLRCGDLERDVELHEGRKFDL